MVSEKYIWPLNFKQKLSIGDQQIKKIGMLCMQELFFWGGWITWNIVSDVYIFTKRKKSINAEKNENVELTHTQVFCGRLCVLCE